MQAWLQGRPAGCGYDVQLLFILIIACVEVDLQSFVSALQDLPDFPSLLCSGYEQHCAEVRLICTMLLTAAVEQ